MLPKDKRIKKQAEFKEIFTRGRVVSNEFFTIHYDFKAIDPVSGTPIGPRAAVVTPKKLGKAHARNRLRRQVWAQLGALAAEYNSLRLIVIIRVNNIDAEVVAALTTLLVGLAEN